VFGVDVSLAPTELTQQPNFIFQHCDITKNSEIDSAIKKCEGTFNGRIDVLLNIAGIADRSGSCDTTTDEEWDRVIAVNLTAPARLIKAVLPYMRKQRSGSIVNTSSRAGLGGGVCGVAYTTSKHGVVSWSPVSMV
jgi:NAD(P)-dependent dehydrogenase (short-subunit alcohol dehydrogenase family)